MLTAVNLVDAPQKEKFYRFKAAKSQKYLKGETTTEADNNGYYHMLNTTGDDGAKSIFYYDDSKHFLSYYCGQYTTATSYLAEVGATSINTYKFEAPYKYGGALSVTAEQSINESGTRLYSHSDEKTYANQQSSKAEETDWTVEEVTSLPVTITSAGYATLYSPVALTIPTGVTAYTATDNETYLTLTAIEGGTIPAETGVILAGEAGTYNLAITTGGSVEGNALSGTVAAITRPEGSYILATGNSGVGFYGDGATTIPGFKAYLPAAGGSAKGFVGFDFDDDATAISSPFKGEEGRGSSIYNLAGQRISKMQKGINIVNGKKVMVK